MRIYVHMHVYYACVCIYVIYMYVFMYYMFLLCGYIAVDLIKKLLTVDPKKRITTSEALDHKWIKVSIMSVCVTGGVMCTLVYTALHWWCNVHSCVYCSSLVV